MVKAGFIKQTVLFPVLITLERLTGAHLSCLSIRINIGLYNAAFAELRRLKLRDDIANN